MKKIKVLNVVGARPNFMKIAPVINELKKIGSFETYLVHTGQHYDECMSDVFLKEFGLPVPDLYLNAGSGTHAHQTAKVMMKIEEVLMKNPPDVMIVVGDVNSTMASALAAAKLRVPIAHIEAGLRSFDREMPEEINRIVTDVVSDYLFTTCIDGNKNLLKEGIRKEKIFFVGNVMIDTLKLLSSRALSLNTVQRLGLESKKYALLTLHRPSNVDDKAVFGRILSALRDLSRKLPVIFPAHPRTKKQIDLFGFGDYFQNTNLKLIEPLGYLDFMNLMFNSMFVLTDSGGIQEETTAINIPCLTLRNNTERPITIREGTNTLVGSDPKRILEESEKIFSGKYKKGKVPKLWDGRASERIARVLCEAFR